MKPRAADAESVAHDGRRVSGCSSPVCARFGPFSLWKMHSYHDIFRQ